MYIPQSFIVSLFKVQTEILVIDNAPRQVVDRGIFGKFRRLLDLFGSRSQCFVVFVLDLEF